MIADPTSKSTGPAITSSRADGVAMLGSTMFVIERRRLVDLVAKNRLPAVYPLREFVDAGALCLCGERC